MPKFKKSALQRGAAAIKESAERSSSGSTFRPFAPELQWRGDGAERYVLFLSDIDSMWRLPIHEFIEVGKGKKANGETYTKYEKFLCRTSPAIGEPCRLCDLEDNPKDRIVGVAVELEPVTDKDDKGRQRIVGFEVATQEFTRKIKGDDDEFEEVEVTAPLIGLVTQASSNFYNTLTSFAETKGPVEEYVFHVKRNGAKKNVGYTFVHFEEPVDLSGLIDNIDGITYLADELEPTKNLVDETSSMEEAAAVIATALLDRHLDEIADGDRFEELTGDITYIEQRFGGNGGNNRKGSGAKRSSAPRKREELAEEPAAEAAEDPTAGLSRAERFKQLKADLDAQKK